MLVFLRQALLYAAVLILPATLSLSACAQETTVRADLYDCEGCAGVYERESENLTATTEMASKTEPGERLVIRGQVFKVDRITPAAGVILYFYQTNHEGIYANGSSETQWSRRHGRIRGWLKTDKNGHYEIRTIKPAPYPNAAMPAHIHPTILEPGKPPYWIDDIVFAGEFGVTKAYKARMSLRGGDGIVQLRRSATGDWAGKRDIYLEPHPK